MSEENQEDKEQSRHDPFFKVGMKEPKISKPFLKKTLPAELQKHMDFDKLEVVSENLITERLGHKVVDVLFKIPYRGVETLLSLIEHQSTVPRFMPFRLHLYAFLAIDEWLRTHAKEATEKGESQPRKLPNIIPMVCYNGEF